MDIETCLLQCNIGIYWFLNNSAHLANVDASWEGARNMPLGLESPISAVFKKVDESIQKALSGFLQYGDILLGHIGEELSIQMKNAKIIYDQALEKTLFELGEGPLRQMFMRMDELSDRIDSYIQAAFDFEQIMALDLEYTLSGFGDNVFSLYPHRFIMKKIMGTTQEIHSDQPYTMSLMGTNLGTAPSDVRTKVTIWTGPDYKTEIKTQQSQLSQHVVLLSLPVDVINGMVTDPKKITLIPVKVSVKYEYRTGGLFRTWKSHLCEYPVTLAIMPEYAGHLRLRVVYQTFNWVYYRQASATYQVTEGANYSEPWLRVDMSERLEGARLDCTDDPQKPGGLAFKEETGPHYNGDHTYVKFSVHYWGNPFSENITADVHRKSYSDQEYTVDVDFKWSELIELTIPINMWVAASIKGELITGQEFSFALEGHDETKSLRVEKVQPGASSAYIQIKAKRLI